MPEAMQKATESPESDVQLKGVHIDFVNRLRSERGEPPVEQGPTPGPEDDAGDPSDRQSEEPETEEPDGPTEVEDDEEALPEEEPEEGSVEYFRQKLTEAEERIEAAEERARNMERDYRVKTHQLGQSRRELERASQNVERQYQYFTQVAEQSVQRFANVNWDLLKSEPDKYSQARQAYETAVRQRDQVREVSKRIAEQNKAQLEKLMDEEAKLSVSILRSSIPDWSNEKLHELQRFAADELGYYTDSELEDLVDWRVYALLHELRDYRDRVKSLKDVKPPRKRREGKPPVSDSNRPQPKRDASGKFQTSRQRMMDRPGDKSAAFDFFRQKVSRDRSRGR